GGERPRPTDRDTEEHPPEQEDRQIGRDGDQQARDNLEDREEEEQHASVEVACREGNDQARHERERRGCCHGLTSQPLANAEIRCQRCEEADGQVLCGCQYDDPERYRENRPPRRFHHLFLPSLGLLLRTEFNRAWHFVPTGSPGGKECL